MARPKIDVEDKPKRRRPPARTPESRENQLISSAYDLAQKQIDEGTATSQVLTHFLKRGSIKDQLELENLKQQNKLLKAKTEHIESEARIEDLYKDALEAMREYKGQKAETDETT